MKATLIILSFLLTISSFAKTCPDLVKKSVSPFKLKVKTSSDTYKTFYNTIKHYRSELDSEFQEEIISAQSYRKGSQITGYEIIIDNGGDESQIRYVLNAKKKIIVAYLSNQSPMTYWFCGKDDVQKVEYTLDGFEI